VPNGYYIMLGDNRNNSDDSHLWGFLQRDQFVGHAFFVFWPLTRSRLLH
jgi:signal peptidase I